MVIYLDLSLWACVVTALGLSLTINSLFLLKRLFNKYPKVFYKDEDEEE